MTTCQVLARWRVGAPIAWREWPDDVAAFWVKAQDPGGPPSDGEAPAIPSSFAPDDYEADAETKAALEAWREEGLELSVRPEGIIYPDRLPFLLDHVGEPLAELQVERVGDQFTAFGELSEDAAAQVRGIVTTSDHLRFRRARIVEFGVGMRAVEVTEAELLELSATATPHELGTALMVGNPGVRWVPAATVERFAALEFPDRLTLSFPLGST